jgi:two-component system, NarL family, sensor kinase
VPHVETVIGTEFAGTQVRLPADVPAAIGAFVDLSQGTRPSEGAAGEHQLVVLDRAWRILAVNGAWAGFARTYGYGDQLAVGVNLKHFCERRFFGGLGQIDTILEGIRALEDGAEAFGRTCKSLHERRYHHVSLTPLTTGGSHYVILSRQDVTGFCAIRQELARLDDRVQELETALLHVRQQERERIGRELHDGAAQWLVGIKLGLGQLRRMAGSPAVQAVVEDMTGLVGHFQRDLRTLARDLHPPQLTQSGLHHAISSLCLDLAQRTGLRVTLNIYGAEPGEPTDVDAAGFRVVQEALSNIHKHASALRVRVRVTNRAGALLVAVTDDGTGLSGRRGAANDDPGSCGFGIPGMIARVHERGGRIVIHDRPGRRGTVVAALLPRDG